MRNFAIGVIRQQHVSAERAPRTVEGVDEFSERISSRYLPREFSISRADLALAYEPASIIHYDARAQFGFAPSMVFNDHLHFAPASKAARPVDSSRNFGAADAEALFHGLLSRQQRTPALTSTPAPDLSSASKREQQFPKPPSDLGQPVERVLPRAAGRTGSTVKTSQAAVNHAPDGPDVGWGTRTTPPAAPKQFTLPDPEVKRVTDHVLREMEHRIIARRERMGRG